MTTPTPAAGPRTAAGRGLLHAIADLSNALANAGMDRRDGGPLDVKATAELICNIEIEANPNLTEIQPRTLAPGEKR